MGSPLDRGRPKGEAACPPRPGRDPSALLGSLHPTALLSGGGLRAVATPLLSGGLPGATVSVHPAQGTPQSTPALASGLIPILGGLGPLGGRRLGLGLAGPPCSAPSTRLGDGGSCWAASWSREWEQRPRVLALVTTGARASTPSPPPTWVDLRMGVTGHLGPPAFTPGLGEPLSAAPRCSPPGRPPVLPQPTLTAARAAPPADPPDPAPHPQAQAMLLQGPDAHASA